MTSENGFSKQSNGALSGEDASDEEQKPRENIVDGQTGAEGQADEHSEADAPSPDDFVPKAVMEQRIRQLQGAKDKEIAAMQRRLRDLESIAQSAGNQAETTRQPAANHNPPQFKSAFDRNKALELAQEDAIAALDYTRNAAVEDARQSIAELKKELASEVLDSFKGYMNETMTVRQTLDRYQAEMADLAQKAGLSQEEYSTAMQIAGSSLDRNGIPSVKPWEVIKQVRFGDDETLFRLAQQGMQAEKMRRQQAPQQQPPQQPGKMGFPPLPGPPPVPGGGTGNARPNAPGNPGEGQERVYPGAWREIGRARE